MSDETPKPRLTDLMRELATRYQAWNPGHPAGENDGTDEFLQAAENLAQALIEQRSVDSYNEATPKVRKLSDAEARERIRATERRLDVLLTGWQYDYAFLFLTGKKPVMASAKQAGRKMLQEFMKELLKEPRPDVSGVFHQIQQP